MLAIIVPELEACGAVVKLRRVDPVRRDYQEIARGLVGGAGYVGGGAGNVVSDLHLAF